MEAVEVTSSRAEAQDAAFAAGCATFLEDHSAYLDECLGPDEAAAHEAHAARCPSCARYARVLERGLTLARDLPEIEPSAHFEERLRHRIFHIEDAERLERNGGRSMTGLAAAALIALIAWSPLLWRGITSHATSTVADAASYVQADAGVTNDLAQMRAGDATHPRWFVQPVQSELDQMPVVRLVSYAGSYSPLVVSPPAARGPRAVRLISAISK